MSVQGTPEQLVGFLEETIVALVRRDSPDLTARQLGVFLTVYLDEEPHTVRGLAASLNVSKPPISRALDCLEKFGFAHRKIDPKDRRSVLVQQTTRGTVLLREIGALMDRAAAASNVRIAPSAAFHRTVGLLKDTIVALVRRDGPDLTARQFSIFLTVYLKEGPHTVRGLSAALNISKPAITRSVDRLVEFDLAHRKPDPRDRRSVHIQRTERGAALLREMLAIVGEAAISEDMQSATQTLNSAVQVRDAS